MYRIFSSIAFVCLAAVLAFTTFHFRPSAPRYEAQASRFLAVQEQSQNDHALIASIRKAQADEVALKTKKPAPPKIAQPATYVPQVIVRAPVVKPAAPAVPKSYNSIDNLIKSVFAPLGSGAVAWALRVADCESGDNPRAINYAGGWYGLFQFSMSTFRSTPYGGGDVLDALTNAKAAEWLYSREGGSPWGCS